MNAKTLCAPAVILACGLMTSVVEADPPAFNNAVLKGTYHCVLTTYGLPAKTSQPFAVVATGNINAVADGNGNLTQGTWDYTIDSPGAHAACKLKMASGTYSINQDGTGTEKVKWLLDKSGSSPDCETWFPDSGDVPTSDTQLIVTDPSGAMSYSSTLSKYAISASVCQR